MTFRLGAFEFVSRTCASPLPYGTQAFRMPMNAQRQEYRVVGQMGATGRADGLHRDRHRQRFGLASDQAPGQTASDRREATVLELGWRRIKCSAGSEAIMSAHAGGSRTLVEAGLAHSKRAGPPYRRLTGRPFGPWP